VTSGAVVGVYIFRAAPIASDTLNSPEAANDETSEKDEVRMPALHRPLDGPQSPQDPFPDERIFKGSNSDLVISNGGVTITGGAKRALMTSFSGDKVIPWESITDVQYHAATVLQGEGYIQVILGGAGKAKRRLSQPRMDPHTVTWSNMFRPTQKNAEFAEARDLILGRIGLL
jgi:hypothetical protein